MVNPPDKTQLLELHTRQQATLRALRAEIAALSNGAAIPNVLTACEAELVAALEHTVALLQTHGIEMSVGPMVVHNQASNQGAIGTFHGPVTIHNDGSGKNPWTCYKCSTANQPYTNFCVNCRAQLLRMCPECKNNTSLISTNICGTCGYHYDVAMEREDLLRQIKRWELEIKKTEKEYQEKTRIKGEYWYLDITMIAASGLIFALSVGLLINNLVVDAIAWIFSMSAEIKRQTFNSLAPIFILVAVALFGWLLLRYRNYKQRKGINCLQRINKLRQDIERNKQRLNATNIVQS